MKRQDVVFSGMRPTGRLHLGNYWGALKNWVGLMTQYPCYFSVVDWHMLTTGYNDTSELKANVREMVLDWLAAGLDPAQCVIFRQSDVPEHAELALMLAMITPLSSLENNPTWKEQLQELSKTKANGESSFPKRKKELQEISRVKAAAPPTKRRRKPLKQIRTTAAQYELRTFGFLGYPVLQAADILLYHGTKVPVGQDQLPHLELSREIARKFNHAFGEVFAEPQPLLTPTPKVPGTDGRKMSKSYHNAIDIYETAASLEKKVKSMYTDPTRKRADDPGHPEPCPENPPGCSVYALHKLYADESFVKTRGDVCRAGQIGCSACKKDLLLRRCLSHSTTSAAAARRYGRRRRMIDAILADGARKRAPSREDDGRSAPRDEAPLMAEKPYQVTLELFEGPLDLLLFLVKKDDLDIHNIPIALITTEYLKYLDMMKELNLDVAGEFLVMAATLMAYKARALLPSQAALNEEDGPDPTAELAQKLLEYQKFKEATKFFAGKADEMAGTYFRGAPVFEEAEKSPNLSLFELMDHIRVILADADEEDESRQVAGEEFPIEEKIAKIMFLLSNVSVIAWEDLFADERKRRGIIACFLAMLELTKLQKIFIRQDANFGKIRIFKKEEGRR